MYHYLRLPRASLALVSEIFRDDADHEQQALMTGMLNLREEMRLNIKAFNNGSNKDVAGVVRTIAAYLLRLKRVIEYIEENSKSVHMIPEFAWKSAIIDMSNLKPQAAASAQKGSGTPGGTVGKKGGSHLAGPAQQHHQEERGGAEGQGSPKVPDVGVNNGMRSFKQRKYSAHSLDFELSFVLTALGIAKLVLAYSRINSFDVDTELTPAVDDIYAPAMTAVSAMLDGDNGQRQKASNSDEAVMEAKTSYREVTSAGSDLVTAAGIFQYLRENLVPRLEQQGIVVPDLMEEVQQMFENLALADSTRLSVRLGVHYRKVKPMILARLLLYVHEEYRKAYRMLFGGLDESRHVTFQMRRYLAENQRTVYAQALMFAAMAYADEERFGVATGLMVEARRHLIKVIENTSDGTPFPTTDGGISSAAMPSTPNPSMLATGTAAAAAATVAGRVMPRDAGDTSLCRGSVRWLVLNVVDDLLNMYVRNNDQVGLEPVPSRAELQACMPPSVSISKPSPFSWDIVRELARI